GGLGDDIRDEANLGIPTTHVPHAEQQNRSTDQQQQARREEERPRNSGLLFLVLLFLSRLVELVLPCGFCRRCDRRELEIDLELVTAIEMTALPGERLAIRIDTLWQCHRLRRIDLLR